jgi:hypothetical protein
MKTPMQELIETLELSKLMYGRDTVKVDAVIQLAKQIQSKREMKEEIHPDSSYGQWMKRFNKEER